MLYDDLTSGPAFNDDEFETLSDRNERQFDLRGIQQINIDYTRASVRVTATSGDHLILRESLSDPTLRVQTRQTATSLDLVQGPVPYFMRFRVKVQILIPSWYSGDLHFRDQRGKLRLRDLLNLQRVSLEVHHGVVTLDNLKAESLAVASFSGKVTLNRTRVATTLNAGAQTGVTILNEVACAQFEIRTVTGTIKSNRLSGQGTISNQTGTIAVGFEQVLGDVAVTNRTGTVQLAMPALQAYDFDLEASHGTVKIDHGTSFEHDVLGLKVGTVGRRPQYRLTVRTNSGTVRVD